MMDQDDITQEAPELPNVDTEILKALNRLSNDVDTIKKWVIYFGVLSILGLIIGGCNMILY